MSRHITTVGTTYDCLIADFDRVSDIIFVQLQNSAKNALTEPGELVVKCKRSPDNDIRETWIIKFHLLTTKLLLDDGKKCINFFTFQLKC